MSRGNLIFPLECQPSSLVTEYNFVMSSLGKRPGVMLHKPGEGKKTQTLQNIVPGLLFVAEPLRVESVLMNSCET